MNNPANLIDPTGESALFLYLSQLVQRLGASPLAQRAVQNLQRTGQAFTRWGQQTYTLLASQRCQVQTAVPELGSKLEFFLGRATGNAHNVGRSTDLLKQLERIGLFDNPATRQYLMEHLTRVLNDPSSIVRIQENGRIVRQSLLMGPDGGAKLETIWEGTKLITPYIFGGQ